MTGGMCVGACGSSGGCRREGRIFLEDDGEIAKGGGGIIMLIERPAGSSLRSGGRSQDQPRSENAKQENNPQPLQDGFLFYDHRMAFACVHGTLSGFPKDSTRFPIL